MKVNTVALKSLVVLVCTTAYVNARCRPTTPGLYDSWCQAKSESGCTAALTNGFCNWDAPKISEEIIMPEGSCVAVRKGLYDNWCAPRLEDQCTKAITNNICTWQINIVEETPTTPTPTLTTTTIATTTATTTTADTSPTGRNLSCLTLLQGFESYCSALPESSCTRAKTNNYCEWGSANGDGSGDIGIDDTDGVEDEVSTIAPGSYGPNDLSSSSNNYCSWNEALVLVSATEVRVQIPLKGTQVICASGFSSVSDAVIGKDGSIFVVEEQTQLVKKIEPQCGSVSTILSSANGLITPTSIAYKDNRNTGYSLFVAARQSSFEFQFSPSGQLLASNPLPLPGKQYLSYLTYDGTNLVAVDSRKFFYKLQDNAWTSAIDIPSAVSIGQVTRGCNNNYYIAAEGNNQILRCSDFNNPASCIPVCTSTTIADEIGITNPWAVGVGVDCSIFSSSRGLGLGKIYKYDPRDCGGSMIHGFFPGNGGIKAIIPFHDNTVVVNCSHTEAMSLSCSEGWCGATI
eukprot:Awhi_evm2s9750